MKKLVHVVLAGVALTAVSCSTRKVEEEKLPDGVGLNLSYVDTTVRPQDDFFKYVNGGWIAKTNIPADQGRWGSFNELREYNNDVVLKVLKKAAENTQLYPEGTDQRKASDFYSIGMDSTLAERVGITPIKPIMAQIDAIKSKNDIQSYLVEDVLTGGGAFFGLGILPDLKNSKKMAAYLGSGGIGLPERDYYLKDDPKSKETREKYKPPPIMTTCACFGNSAMVC